MVIHYFKTAVRNLSKNKIISLINLLGFTIGLASAMIILLFVLEELSYDRYHKHRNQIYRVTTRHSDLFNSSQAPFPLAQAIKDNLPEIELVTRIEWFRADIKDGEGYIENIRFRGSDNDIFKVFTLPFLEGDPREALSDPYSVVISETAASIYFENQDAIGKTLIIRMMEQEYNLTVTGVMRDIPKTSSFKTDFIVPIELAVKYWGQMWQEPDYYTYWEEDLFDIYLMVPEDYDISQIDNKFREIENSHLPEEARTSFHLQSLKDVYLRSAHLSSGDHDRIDAVLIFAVIGLFILIIASINYIILSTARSFVRSKEIGIRKVFGAGRPSLLKQIMGESTLMSFLALPMALLLTHLFLPYVNQLFNRELAVNYGENVLFITGFIVLTLFIGLSSGAYLGVYLSSFNPLDVLKSKINTGISKSVYQKVLIVIQLIIFIVLVLSAGIVNRQIHYANNKELGFNKEGLLSIYFEDTMFIQRYESFKEELSAYPEIINISAAAFGLPYNGGIYMHVPMPDDPDQEVKAEAMLVDYNYLETVGFELLEGRSFSKEYGSDSGSVIINETAFKQLGLTDPIGTEVKDYTVIGVVKDFHLHSFHMEINPMFLALAGPEDYYEVTIRISTDRTAETLAMIESKWSEFAPDSPFDYSFFDDSLESMYQEEKIFVKIITVFTFLAILIASLGLFGLSLFIAEQRTKEIGIRKVVGSSIFQIIQLITRKYLFMILVANILSIPFALYIMDKWLQNFAYRTIIEIWLFFVAASLSLIIVLLTMSFHTIRAARKNPVIALRYE